MKVRNVLLGMMWLFITIAAGVGWLYLQSFAFMGFFLILALLVAVAPVMFSRTWNEIKDMPTKETVKALLFNLGKADILSKIETINNVFYDIMLDNDVQLLGIDLATIFRHIKQNKISLPLAVKVKLFKFYQKHKELMDVIRVISFCDVETKELMVRVPKLQVLVIELARIIDDPKESWQKLEEVYKNGSTLSRLHNDLNGAEKDYTFLVGFIEKQRRNGRPAENLFNSNFEC